MAVQVIPSQSFWAMLPQMTSQALDRYYEGKDRKTAKEERERNQTLQQLGILQTQAAQGADVNDEISKLLEKIGLPNVSPRETPEQLQARIMAMPESSFSMPDIEVPWTGLPSGGGAPIQGFEVKGRDSVSDDELRRARLPTRFERKREDVESSGLDVQGQINAIKARAARGEEITEHEANLAGIKTRQQVGLEGATNVATFIKGNAGPYIKEWFAKNGGQVGPNNMDTMIDQSYGAFVERFGDKIPESARTDARAYFAEEAYQLYKDRLDEDYRRNQLGLQREIANLRNRGGSDPETSGRLVDMLTRMGNGIENDIQTTFQGRTHMLMQELVKMQQNPNYKSQLPGIDEFRAQVQKLEQVRSASAMAAMGLTTDPKLQEMLTTIASGTPTGTGAPTGGQGTAPPVMRGGKRVITSDMKQYLMSQGAWDASKYVVDDNE